MVKMARWCVITIDLWSYRMCRCLRLCNASMHPDLSSILVWKGAAQSIPTFGHLQLCLGNLRAFPSRVKSESAMCAVDS